MHALATADDRVSHGGFFAVSRDIFDHPVVGAEKPYSRLEAWLWLVRAAAYLPRSVPVKNGQTRSVVTLQRGQATFARSFLGEAWGWTEKRVRTFLKQLERERQIDLQTGRQQTLITICNYERYQMPTRQKDRQMGRHKAPQRATNGPEEEQGNKETKENARTRNEEQELYERGKEILGETSGGLITKLVQAKGGNIHLARAAIETAATKQNKREYVGAIIRGRNSPEDLRARGEAW